MLPVVVVLFTIFLGLVSILIWCQARRRRAFLSSSEQNLRRLQEWLSASDLAAPTVKQAIELCNSYLASLPNLPMV